MKKIALVLLAAFAAVNASAEEKPTPVPNAGFYRLNTKNLSYSAVSGLVFGTGNSGERTAYWPPMSYGNWFYSWKNDRFLLLGTSLDLLVNVGNNGAAGNPEVALGITLAPVGVRLTGNPDLCCGDDPALYLEPTYTFMAGLNGHFEHWTGFGARFSFAWR